MFKLPDQLSKYTEIAVITFFSAAIFCAIFYRFAYFNAYIAILGLILGIASTFILNYYGLFFNQSKSVPKIEKSPYFSEKILTFITIILAFGIAATISSYYAQNSIITPWEILPNWLFLLYAILVFLTIKQSKTLHSKLALLVISTIVIPLVYSLGYGYDFFIHQASISEIIKNGAILPKTNFYFGEYILILLSSYFLPLSVHTIHLWLVPAFSVLLIGFAFYRIRQNEFEISENSIILLLLLPYSFTTYSTPQNLAFVILATETILLTKPTRHNSLFATLLVLLNLTIHPISAIPGLALLVLVFAQQNQALSKRLFLLGILLPLSIPLLLLGTGSANWSSWNSNINLLWPKIFSFPGSESLLLNSLYTIYFNQQFLTLLTVVFGYFMFRKKIKHLSVNIGLAIGLVIAVGLMQFILIKGVIDYEQADYSKRLLMNAVIVCLPLILITLSWLNLQINKLSSRPKLIWQIALTLLITANFYLIYPRHDRLFNSRGLSVSQADISATEYINSDGGATDYFVLANQQVAAASLGQFGFKKYYGDIFYYPIPTTNPLYSYYLEMVYERPSRETMLQAMNKLKVDRAYFVLNKYWQNFPKLVEQAKLSANHYQSFGNDSVYVFTYTR